jgi:hypothetical protein
MLGHNTLRKHLHFRGHKGSVKKAYVHRACKGSNPLDILFYSILESYIEAATKYVYFGATWYVFRLAEEC